jgi:hypothetical protein
LLPAVAPKPVGPRGVRASELKLREGRSVCGGGGRGMGAEPFGLRQRKTGVCGGGVELPSAAGALVQGHPRKPKGLLPPRTPMLKQLF